MPLQFLLDPVLPLKIYTLSFCGGLCWYRSCPWGCTHFHVCLFKHWRFLLLCCVSWLSWLLLWLCVMFQHHSCEKHLFSLNLCYCSWDFRISSADFAWVRQRGRMPLSRVSSKEGPAVKHWVSWKVQALSAPCRAFTVQSRDPSWANEADCSSKL